VPTDSLVGRIENKTQEVTARKGGREHTAFTTAFAGNGLVPTHTIGRAIALIFRAGVPVVTIGRIETAPGIQPRIVFAFAINTPVDRTWISIVAVRVQDAWAAIRNLRVRALSRVGLTLSFSTWITVIATLDLFRRTQTVLTLLAQGTEVIVVAYVVVWYVTATNQRVTCIVGANVLVVTDEIGSSDARYPDTMIFNGARIQVVAFALPREMNTSIGRVTRIIGALVVIVTIDGQTLDALCPFASITFSARVVVVAIDLTHLPVTFHGAGNEHAALTKHGIRDAIPVHALRLLTVPAEGTIIGRHAFDTDLLLGIADQSINTIIYRNARPARTGQDNLGTVNISRGIMQVIGPHVLSHAFNTSVVRIRCRCVILRGTFFINARSVILEYIGARIHWPDIAGTPEYQACNDKRDDECSAAHSRTIGNGPEILPDLQALGHYQRGGYCLTYGRFWPDNCLLRAGRFVWRRLRLWEATWLQRRKTMNRVG